MIRSFVALALALRGHRVESTLNNAKGERSGNAVKPGGF